MRSQRRDFRCRLTILCCATGGKMSEVQLHSEITCPHCGHKKTETMPTDACQWFYECERCHSLLEPRPGDCCVFCSYGSVPCPPVQLESGCCG
ncbi:GDCCVxC domain-containing (seleno)protein [Microbulbifer hainanensis]